MELSRLAAIRKMVEADMGVGIVPLRSVLEEVADGRLVRWWIEGARVNWELGVARLSGGYLSPVCDTFLRLCRKHFELEIDDAGPRNMSRRKKTDDSSATARKARKKR
jgi:DNA-binding transcriptional LysR family regulator